MLTKPIRITTREYARRGMKITPDIKGNKLHIGCGYILFKDFINIDIAGEPLKPDMIVNIENGLPFPDNYFSHIFSSHVLEHVKPDKFHFVLEEIYRVAKPNCILELHLPYDRISMRTALDHYRTFNWKSFENCEAGNRRNYYINFKVKRLNKMPNKFIRVLSQFFPMFFTDVYFKFRIIK